MPDEQTCGKGLAEHSELPAKISELIASMAKNLEIHLKTLDLNDLNSRKEHAIYQELVKKYDKIAAQLEGTAGRMARYRDLPMGNHDVTTMQATMVVEAFEKFVQLEEELLQLLKMRVEQERKMLAEMGNAGP